MQELTRAIKSSQEAQTHGLDRISSILKSKTWMYEPRYGWTTLSRMNTLRDLILSFICATFLSSFSRV